MKSQTAEITLTLPQPATDVVVTGSFDNWSHSVSMLAHSSNPSIYSATIRVPAMEAMIPYKFVVDGEWMLDPNAPTVQDDQGNVNNVLHVVVPRQDSMATVDGESKQDGFMTSADATDIQLVKPVPAIKPGKANKKMKKKNGCNIL